MAAKGQHTFMEITSQTAAWADAITFLESVAHSLGKAWKALQPTQVLFVGCGSTYYLSQTAASLFQKLVGVQARACPSSELLLFTPQVASHPDQTLLIAVSRSGTTTETLSAVSKFRRLGGLAVWGITCYPRQALAKEVDLVLLAEEAQEKSIAQTRSFASMLVLAQGMAAILAGKRLDALTTLPALGQDLILRTDPLVQRLAQQPAFERFCFLGSGVLFGIANEAMLKMKEMSLSNSEGFHFLEFRHGPKSMIDKYTLVVGLHSRGAYHHEQKLTDEVAELGAKVLSLVPMASNSKETLEIHLDSNVPEWVSPVLYLPPLQLLAYYRAMAKGLDPDNPRHLDAVVFLENADFAIS